MKNKDLIAALQKHDLHAEVAIFNWRHYDAADDPAAGIFPQFNVDFMGSDKVAEGSPSFIALTFDDPLLDPSLFDPLPERKCRVCGCTDQDCSGCIAKTGQPCYWVEEDLCSACMPGQATNLLLPGRDF